MYQEQIDRYFSDLEQSLVRDISGLVAIRSVREQALPGKPFGDGVARALNAAIDLAAGYGLHTRNLENYVGVVDLNSLETRLGIFTHLDVVGEGTGWTTPPYQADLRDGMLYGRGTDDDKGPTVAAIYAMRAVKDLGVPLKYNCRLILGSDEESGFADLDYYFSREPVPPYSFSPDGLYPVINVEKGSFRPIFSAVWEPDAALPRIRSLKGGYRFNVVPPEAEAVVEGLDPAEIARLCQAAQPETGAEYEITPVPGGVRILAKGRGAHASRPEKGNNALTALLAAVLRLPLAESRGLDVLRRLSALFPHGDCRGEAAGIAMGDALSGELTLAFSILDFGLTGLTGRFDSRTPLCSTRENTVDVVRAGLERAGLTVERENIGAPHHTPADSEFVKLLLDVFHRYTGMEGYCSYAGGGTYIHGLPNGVCFGCSMPGFVSNPHGADEHISVSDMLLSAKMFTQIIIDMCT